MLLSRFAIILAFTVNIAFLPSCQDTKFKGSSNARGNQVPENKPVDPSQEYQKDHPNEPIGDNPVPGRGVDPKTGLIPGDGKYPFNVKHMFQLGCDASSDAHVKFAEKEDYKIEAVVRGEICPESTKNLHVLFIVDFSGSMGAHFDPGRNVESEGHDPVVGKSCGRLSAASALLEKIAQQAGSKDDIKVSLVPFANVAIDKLERRNIGLQDFRKNYLDRQHFCRYVAQEGHEKIGESLSFLDLGFKSPVNPSTNYAAGFDRAREILRSSGSSHSRVIFITDGEPTEPVDRATAIAAAEKSGAALRSDSNIANQSIYGLYLGIKGTSTYDQAAGVLAKVTGSPDSVLPAENADALVTRIMDLPKPDINLNAKDYAKMATISVDPYGEYPLGIQYLKEVRTGVWEYQTQPFILLGNKGKSIDNRVGINIFSESGFLFKTLLHIDYTQQ